MDKPKMKLNFYITEYVDGKLKIETKHMHYAFRDDLNYDDIGQGELYKTMLKIRDICKAENVEPVFRFL